MTDQIASRKIEVKFDHEDEAFSELQMMLTFSPLTTRCRLSSKTSTFASWKFDRNKLKKHGYNGNYNVCCILLGQIFGL
uniref:Uncharacterized protein n=1 Tax=Romanomermis culicivorax TaxID=13658 RepID=A0A915IY82_ROMCU